MDSPENKDIGSKSPPFQDSPFFNYLSTLSPIVQTRSLRVAQRLSGINLASPPPVFTSPRDARVLKGAQGPGSSNINARLPFKYSYSNMVPVVDPHISNSPAIQSEVQLIPHTEASKSKDSGQGQSGSPSGCVDEYLTDPLEDCICTDDFCGLSSKKIKDLTQGLQSGCSPKETTAKPVSHENVQEDLGSQENTTLISSGKAKEDLVSETSMVNIDQVELVSGEDWADGVEQENDKRLSGVRLDLTSKDVSDLARVGPCVESTSSEQYSRYLVDQTATDKENELPGGAKEVLTTSSDLCFHGVQAVKHGDIISEPWSSGDGTSNLLPASFQNIQVDSTHNENVDIMSNGAPERAMPYDSEEVSQLQRGTRRRCLQFEAAEAQRSDLLTIVTTVRSPAKFMDSKTSNMYSQAESNIVSTNQHVVSLIQQASSPLPICSSKTPVTYTSKADKSAQNRGSLTVTASVPSGIGLHLNSIVKAVSVCSNIPEEKSPGSSCHFPEGSKSSVVRVSSVRNVSAKVSAKSLAHSALESTDLDQQRSQSLVISNSLANIQPSLHDLEVLNDSQQLNHIQPSLHDLEVLNDSQQLNLTGQPQILYEKQMHAVENNSRLDDFNQTSPRKKRKRAAESEGCKRCNCKKSKCLKLYCECFAAGVYCAEPCTCRDCFNKPECEDRVLETRQQIESRNPLAFVPRVVQRVSESPQNSAEAGNWTTPASARHKRGCNCKKSLCLKKYCECYQAGVGCSEGCRCEGCKNIFGKKEGCTGIVGLEHRKVEGELGKEVPRMLKLAHLDQHHSDKFLTPTPLIRCSSHGRDVSKFHHPSRKQRASSPESESSVLSSYDKSPRSLGISNVNMMHVETTGYPTDNQQDPHMEVDLLSPGWDGFDDICVITPLTEQPESSIAVSASSDVNYCPKGSHASLCHRSGRVSGDGPLKWRGSPVTPTARFGGAKFVIETDSASRLYNTLEDETPDILKETYSPIKAVKISSPNQKRVSPPLNCLHELRRSSSSTGFQSGRKFILQSVPSFPPLSPYSEPKRSKRESAHSEPG